MVSGKTILVVDDEAKIRGVYQDLLELEGYEVEAAESAQDATRLLLQLNRGIDLVLLDINMPLIDGRTMYEVIREYDPDMKVIVTSVYQIDEQRERIPDATDYFDKSRENDLLLEKIRQVLDV